MQTTRLWVGVAGAVAARQVARKMLRVGFSLVAGSLLLAVVVLLLASGQTVWLWTALSLQCFALAGWLLAASGWLTLRSLHLRDLARRGAVSRTTAVEQNLSLAA
jgi:hypothetical protein